MKAKMHEKIAYAFGCVPHMLEYAVMASYLSLYCTDVLNLTPALIGTMILVVRILDAVTDILIVNIADKTESRFGKYRTWLLIGIPYAILFYLFFSPPSFLNTDYSKMLWIVCIYLLLVPVCETGYCCVMAIMSTVMSPDAGDRMDFVSARTIGEAMGELIVNGLCMTIILSAGSYKNLAGWHKMAFVFAGIMLVCSVIGITGIKERVQKSDTNEDGTHLTLKQKLQILFTERPFLRVVGINLGMSLIWIVTALLLPYYCIYSLGHEEWVAPLVTIGVVAQLIGTAAISYIGRKYEKRTILFAAAVCLGFSAMFLLLPQSFASIAVFQIFKGLGYGLSKGAALSYIPDVTEYLYWKRGAPLYGMSSALLNFCGKTFSAFVSWGVMLILQVSGYDATKAVQLPVTEHAIYASLIIAMIIGTCVIVIINYRLRELSRAKLQSYIKANLTRD